MIPEPRSDIRVKVRPSRPASAALAGVGLLFLLVGYALFGAAEGEDSALYLLVRALRLIWLAGCLTISGFGVYSLVCSRPTAILSMKIKDGRTPDGQNPSPH